MLGFFFVSVLTTRTLLLAQFGNGDPIVTPMQPTLTPTYESVEILNPAKIQITTSFNKSEIAPQDTFEFTIQLENTSSVSTFKNVEIRLPFLNSIVDTSVSELTPQFNKILTSQEFPINFNNRSWLINSFEPKAKRNFVVSFVLKDSLTLPNGLQTVVTLPLEWKDPAGLSSGTKLSLEFFRADIYYEGDYFKSVEAKNPKVMGFDTELSFVTLPAVFNNPRTTDLKLINKDNILRYENFALETNDIIIQWTEPVDLSASKTKEQFSQLDQYILTKNSSLEINVSELDYLNVGADITFKNISLLIPPQIRINEDIKQFSEIPNAKWDETQKTIKFNLKKLFSVALLPNIEIKPSDVIVKNRAISLSGRVSHPRGDLAYVVLSKKSNVNDKKYIKIQNKDITSGEFDVKIEIPKDIQFSGIEITLTDPVSQQVGTKIVTVNLDKEGEQEEINGEEISDTTDISIWENPLIVPLITIFVVLVLITLSYIGYLYYKAKKAKKNNPKSLKIENNNVNSFTSKIKESPHSTSKIQIKTFPTKSMLDDEEEIIKSNSGVEEGKETALESKRENDNVAKDFENSINNDSTKSSNSERK